MDIIYDLNKPLRIEQLRDEIMALGVPSVTNVYQVSTPDVPLVIHVEADTLTSDQQTAIEATVAHHVPAPLPPTEREIALSNVLGDLEAAWPNMDLAQKIEALKGAVMWYVQFNVQRPE